MRCLPVHYTLSCVNRQNQATRASMANWRVPGGQNLLLPFALTHRFSFAGQLLPKRNILVAQEAEQYGDSHHDGSRDIRRQFRPVQVAA